MATALSENPASVIHSINLAHNTLDNQGTCIKVYNTSLSLLLSVYLPAFVCFYIFCISMCVCYFCLWVGVFCSSLSLFCWLIVLNLLLIWKWGLLDLGVCCCFSKVCVYVCHFVCTVQCLVEKLIVLLPSWSAFINSVMRSMFESANIALWSEYI